MLYILHGWSYSTEKWEPFLDLLEKSGVEYRMLKIPGLTAPLDQVWALDDYVYWLKLEATSPQPTAILGHSNGGRIAAVFAAKYPHKVRKLILVDSAGIIHRDLKTLFKRTLFRTAAKIGKRITSRNLIRNLTYKLAGEQDYNRADPILKEAMLNLISQDLEPIFSKIKVPTLIVWGRDDRATPLSDGRKIHELIPGSKFQIIENAKHAPQFTHPKEVSEIITKILADSQ